MEEDGGDFLAFGGEPDRADEASVVAPGFLGGEFELRGFGRGQLPPDHDPGGGAEDFAALGQGRRIGGMEEGIDLAMGILVPPEADGALVRGADLIPSRGGVIGGPNGEFFLGQGREIGFRDRAGEAEGEVAIGELVHVGSRDMVVVVFELGIEMGLVAIGGAEHSVEFEKVRMSLGFEVDGPVVCGREAERARGDGGGDVHVALTDAEVDGILTGAAALHGGGDHDARKRGADPGIDHREHHGLGGAAAGSGDEDASGIAFGQAEEEIESADAVPGLQAEVGLESGGGLRTDESPSAGFIGSQFGAGAVAMFGKLDRVRIAEHVIEKNDAAHPGQLNAAGLEGEPGPVDGDFGAGLDFLLGFGVPGIEETPVGPVAVGAEDHGAFPVLHAVSQGGTGGAVEGAGDEVAGERLEEDAFYLVIAAIQRPVDHGMKRAFFRQGPEAGGDLDAEGDFRASCFPVRGNADGVEREFAVEGEGRGEAAVGGREREEAAEGEDPESAEGGHRGQEGQARSMHHVRPSLEVSGKDFLGGRFVL